MPDEYQSPRHPHDIALQNRNFEIDLFWKRSNYFLVLNTGLAIAFFTESQSSLEWMILIAGLIVSILWFSINLGSKFWQERWEIAVKETEPVYQVRDEDYQLFTKPPHNLNTVPDTTQAELDASVRKRINESSGFSKKAFRGLILWKPSVSFIMIYLSLFSILFWLIPLGYTIYKLCTCHSSGAS